MHISACIIYQAFNDQHRLHWAPSTKGDNTILNSILIYKYIHGRAQHHWAAKLKLKTRCMYHLWSNYCLVIKHQVTKSLQCVHTLLHCIVKYIEGQHTRVTLILQIWFLQLLHGFRLFHMCHIFRHASVSSTYPCPSVSPLVRWSHFRISNLWSP